MKKIIVVLIAIVAIIFVVVKINKKENNLDPNNLGSDANTVIVTDSMPNEIVEIEDVKIENITLNKEDKTLTFRITSENEYAELKLSVVLLKPSVEDSANTTTLVLKDITETKIVNVDLKNIFNDPDKIKFVIEK